MSEKKKKSTAKKSPAKRKQESAARSLRAAATCPQPPTGTVQSEVIDIIKGLTRARPVNLTSTLGSLGVGQQRLTLCLNTHFFPVPLDGIPDGTFGDDTRVSQVIATVRDHLAAQGIHRD